MITSSKYALHVTIHVRLVQIALNVFLVRPLQTREHLIMTIFVNVLIDFTMMEPIIRNACLVYIVVSLVRDHLSHVLLATPQPIDN
jgi:hypothetical protein